MRTPAVISYRRIPIESLALLYFLLYVPYAVLVRWLSTIPYSPFGRPLTGLEILPATTILSAALTLLFAWWSGWLGYAHRMRIAARCDMQPDKVRTPNGNRRVHGLEH